MAGSVFFNRQKNVFSRKEVFPVLLWRCRVVLLHRRTSVEEKHEAALPRSRGELAWSVRAGPG